MKNRLYLLICLLVLAGCRRDDDPAPDPCAELPARLEFTMSKRFLESSNTTSSIKIDTLVADDTFLAWDQIIFTAPEGYQHYEWQVGYDDRTWSTRTFGLTFSAPVEDLPVRLIVRDPIGERAQCLPSADTLTRLLNVVGKMASPLVGRYQGILTESPTDTFRVEVNIDRWGNDYRLFNLNRGCLPPHEDHHYFNTLKRGYRFAIFNYNRTPEGCKTPFGWLSLSANHQHLTAHYSVREMDAAGDFFFKYETFIGQRIP